jgi:predicted component of type VI protein secretion system
MVRAFYSAVVVLLLSAGCAREKPEISPPVPAEASPPASSPAPAATPPASTTKGKAAPPVTKPPAPKAQAPKPVAAKPVAPKPVASGASAAAAREIAAGAPLDLEALKAQLKQTKAIGVFTKLALKNQVDDLMERFRAHHAGKATPSITELRRSYDLLMMKVLSLLQDHDQRLATEIVSSRERIWGLLVNPTTFAALQA